MVACNRNVISLLAGVKDMPPIDCVVPQRIRLFFCVIGNALSTVPFSPPFFCYRDDKLVRSTDTRFTFNFSVRGISFGRKCKLFHPGTVYRGMRRIKRSRAKDEEFLIFFITRCKIKGKAKRNKRRELDQRILPSSILIDVNAIVNSVCQIDEQ